MPLPIWKRSRRPPARTASARVHLGSNRIFILPTKTGVAFSILLVVMLLISINYNNPPGYLLTFLLTGIALVGMFHTHRNISGLNISHGRAAPVFAGERALFPIMIANPSQFPKYAIRIGWSRVEALITGDMAPVSEQVFMLPLAAKHRGLLRPGRFVVATVFPLGLFRAWSWVSLPLRCVVYPTADRATTPLDIRDASQVSPEGRQGQGGEEYHGLRAYQPGDSLRRIAWKAVARGMGLVSKEYTGAARESEIVLDWNDVAGDAETRLSRLCRLILDAEASGRPYGLRLPAQRIAAGSGTIQMHTCLTALALFGLDQGEAP